MADVALEVGESIILFALICYLLVKGKVAALSGTKSWRLLLGGLTLILFARLFEITDQFAFFDHLIVMGQTETAEFLAKGVGSLGGLLVLATGLIQLVPMLQRASAEFTARGRPESMLGRPRARLDPRANERADRFRTTKVDPRACGNGHDWTVQALRQGEERYDLAMEAIREGVYDWNIETGDIYCSPRVKVVLGFSPEELRSVQDWLDRIHPDDTARYISTLIAHLKGKSERFQCEYRFCGKAGEWRWARHHGIAVRTDTGIAYRMAGSIGDITERKRIEEALRESREMLHAVVNAVPAMISAKDPESRYVMMNRYQADIYGVSNHDAIGKTADELLGREYGAYTQQLDRQVFESGEALPYFEEHYSDAKGQLHTWLTTKVPLKNELGCVQNVVSVALDITDRKHAEETLRLSEERLSMALSASKAGYWVRDMPLTRVFWSDENFRLLGYEPGEVEASYEAWVARVHPDDREATTRAFNKSIEDQTDINLEYRVIHPDGTVRWINNVGKPFIGPDGQTNIVTGIQTDITERKEVEGVLLDAKNLAERANRAKGEFLANMSHELRTPLNAVIGFSDTMLQEIYGPIRNTKYVDYIRDIGDAGRHLLAIINDILDLSKIDAGEDELDEREILVSDLVNTCVRMVSERAVAAGVRLDHEIAVGVSRIRADETRLKHIVLNLLSNAIKFTPEDGRVTLGATIDDRGGIVLSVADTGIGIAANDILSVLEPFSQIRENSFLAHEGTGLGLSLAKKLTETHGGVFKLESEVGEGTTVTATFPPERTVSDRTA